METLERRALTGVELRVLSGQAPKLRGYAAKFNAQSLDLGGFVEIIRPGAFARSLGAGTDVLAFVNHDDAKILGRRSKNTLLIEEDTHGLLVEITPPDTQDGRDVIENIRVGNLESMSFAFRVAPDGQRWDFSLSPHLRELLTVDLSEVSVVARPAYPQTEVAMRSLEAARSALAGQYLRGRTVSERLAWTRTVDRLASRGVISP